VFFSDHQALSIMCLDGFAILESLSFALCDLLAQVMTDKEAS